MSETENAFLKSEIARLNKIIEALLSYNEVLRQQTGISEKGNASPNLGSSLNEKDNASPNLGSSLNEKDNAPPNLGSSLNEKENASPNLGSSLNEKNNASPNLGSSLNEKVEITPASVSILNSKLKAISKRKVKSTATHSSAKILLHINNGGKGGYTELSKLTDLSRGGVGKRIMAMKKQGLIISDGHLNYKLTAKGLALVKGGAG